MNQIVTTRDQLKEIIFEYVKSDRSLSSNFISEFSKQMKGMESKMENMDKKIDVHTFQLDKMEGTVGKISDKMDDMKSTQDTETGSKKGFAWAVGIAITIIGAISGVALHSYDGRIDRVEAKVFPIQQ